MTRVVCIGEAMVELRPAAGGLYALDFAGDAFNTAAYLKRRRPEVEVAFLTALGDDRLSLALRARMIAERLDDRLAFTVPGGAPGLYLIEVDAAGERSFSYWRSASAARRWLVELEAHGGADALHGADLVFLSGISLAILLEGDRPRALALLTELARGGVRIAFDPNVRLALWPDLATARAVIEAAAALAAFLLPSDADGAALWGEADPDRQLDRWSRFGAAEILLSRGPAGAILAWRGETRTFEAAPPARVVDTSGAGDSLNGGYLAGRLTGEAPPEALGAALALAARVVASPGALIPADLSNPNVQTQPGAPQ